jgi:hypothetical protein
MSTFCDHAAWINNLKLEENINIHLYVWLEEKLYAAHLQAWRGSSETRMSLGVGS